MADVAPAGSTHRLVLAGAVRRQVVVVEVALDSSGPIVSMRWTSDDGPSVATVSACVSPRVKRAEPWARGRRPTSTVMGRMSVQVAAVHADALVEHQLADDLLVEQAGQALAEARLAAGGLEQRLRVATGPRARIASATAVLVGVDATRQVVREPDQQVRGRLGVRQGPVRLSSSSRRTRARSASLYVLGVRDMPRGR